MVALDIAKAYDSVWKHRILLTLQKWNLCSIILKFINNFLENRTFEIRFRNILSSSITTENGLPQGSSLSVTLFLVAINDISNQIKPPVKILLYADDCNIFCSGANIHNTKALVQTAIDNISQWSKKTGFKFSPSKCKTILFHRKNKILSPTIKMQESILA